MNPALIEAIGKAVERHAPRSHLQKQLIAETTDELRLEASMEHEAGMVIHTMFGAVDILKRLAADEKGRLLLRPEASQLEHLHMEMAFAISAIKAVRK